MGAFYGSIHVRFVERDALLRALAEAAAPGATRFLVAPPGGTWTVVYPSGAGQDFAVSRRLAVAVGGDLVHVLLHDDDVFAFELHRGGLCTDRYSSSPDYFGEVTPEERAALAGRPELLAEFLADGASVAEVAASMERRPPPTVEEVVKAGRFPAAVQLARFARALGLGRVETSYEELREGRSRRGWQHLPNLLPERAAKRSAAAQVNARRRQLQQDGLLLLSEQRPAGPMLGPRPVVCAAPGNGFLVAWSEGVPSRTVPLLYHLAPWRSPIDTGLTIAAGLAATAASPAGTHLAVGHAFGSWLLEVWSLTGRRVVAAVELPRSAEHLLFPAEDRVVCRSQGELLVVSVPEGRVLHRLSVGQGHGCAVHPDGHHVVAGSDEGGIVQFDLDEPASRLPLRTVRHDLARWMRRAQAGEPLAGFHPAEIPRVLAFTSDGRHLLVATTEGPRMYAWGDVLAADRELPSPVAAAGSGLVKVGDGRWLQHTYALDCDVASGRVLFAGLEGRLRSLTADGTEQDLLEIPGTPPLLQLVLSRDGAHVACISQAGLFERGRRPTPRLEVWDWTRLQRISQPASKPTPHSPA